jgi:DNA-binding beta-propeller fold protein YncE
VNDRAPHFWLSIASAVLLVGCGGPNSPPELVWGRQGVQDGDFAKPRAIAIDKQDRLYIVDFTARVQVFDRDGKYLGPTWTTPDYRNGRPSGLSIDRDGNLIVSDSHYHYLRIYAIADGKPTEVRKIGGESGTQPGQFAYICDAVQDADGYFYLGEFGENQRITKLDSNGKLVKCWGCAGSEPGQFSRIRALALSPDGLLYVADACNHRIQVFTRDGELVLAWGKEGKEPGQLHYPYDLAFGPKGDLYVVEFGNHRVQKFTPDGQSLGIWGGPGHKPGQLHHPWALAVDSRGRVHVIDSQNHRVQRISF